MSIQTDGHVGAPVAENEKPLVQAQTGNDPLRTYLDLANRWDAMSKEIDGLVSQLTRAAERVRGNAWRKARVGAYTFPAELAQGSIESWPAADEVGKKMAGWHELKAELDKAWRLVPPEDRRQLKDPPQ